MLVTEQQEVQSLRWIFKNDSNFSSHLFPIGLRSKIRYHQEASCKITAVPPVSHALRFPPEHQFKVKEAFHENLVTSHHEPNVQCCSVTLKTLSRNSHTDLPEGALAQQQQSHLVFVAVTCQSFAFIQSFIHLIYFRAFQHIVLYSELNVMTFIFTEHSVMK